MTHQPAKVLTIGGSDSGGAYGIQTDLKTFTALGTHGMSALTVVTAQNSVGVLGVEWLTAVFLAQQLDAILTDYGAAAAKTGFLGRVEYIDTIVAKLTQYAVPHLVVDPVFVNHHGDPMFPPDVIAAYRQQLFPLATVVTPNKHEVALLTDTSLDKLASWEGMKSAVSQLHALGSQAVLFKGFADGDDFVDVLFDGESWIPLRAPQLDTRNVAGSGDTLSAAIVAFLGMGQDVKTAVSHAHAFTHTALKKSATWQLGSGPGPLAHY